MILDLWNTMYNDSSIRVENAPYRQEVDFPMHEEMVLSSDLETDQPGEQGPGILRADTSTSSPSTRGEELYYDQERMAEEPQKHRKRGRQYHIDADNALSVITDGPSDE